MIRIIILSILMLSGCSIKEVSQSVVQYTISSTAQAQTDGTLSDKIIKIDRFKSPSYMLSTAIWYKKNSYETNSYAFSKFNDNFVDLINYNVANSIQTSKLFKTVFTSYSQIQADLLLEGEITKALQIIDKEQNSSVVFGLNLYLINQKNGKLVDSQTFVYNQKCETTNAQGAIIAYNKIVNRLNKEVKEWLKKSIDKN